MIRVHAESQVLDASSVDRAPPVSEAWRNDLDVARSELAAVTVLKRACAAQARADRQRNGVPPLPIDHRAGHLRAGAPENVVHLGDPVMAQVALEGSRGSSDDSDADIVLAHVRKADEVIADCDAGTQLLNR